MTGLLGRSFLAAAVIIGLVILRALLLHRLPKFTFQAAWAVVILRLLIPFSVPVFDAPDTKAVSWVTDILAGDGREWAVSVGSSQAAGIVRGSDAGRYFGNLSVADSRKIGSSGQDSGITSRKNHGQDKANIADFTENLKQNQEQNMIKTAPGTSNPQSTKAAAKNGTGRAAILRGIWLAGTLSVLFFSFFPTCVRKGYIPRQFLSAIRCRKWICSKKADCFAGYPQDCSGISGKASGAMLP